MLPGISGFDLLRGIRAISQMPVLMLTARGDDVDRIVGLELGADDYLSKPFNPRELVARIRAILRRTQTDARAGASGSSRRWAWTTSPWISGAARSGGPGRRSS